MSIKKIYNLLMGRATSTEVAFFLLQTPACSKLLASLGLARSAITASRVALTTCGGNGPSPNLQATSGRRLVISHKSRAEQCVQAGSADITRTLSPRCCHLHLPPFLHSPTPPARTSSPSPTPFARAERLCTLVNIRFAAAGGRERSDGRSPTHQSGKLALRSSAGSYAAA